MVAVVVAAQHLVGLFGPVMETEVEQLVAAVTGSERDARGRQVSLPQRGPWCDRCHGDGGVSEGAGPRVGRQRIPVMCCVFVRHDRQVGPVEHASVHGVLGPRPGHPAGDEARQRCGGTRTHEFIVAPMEVARHAT